MKVALKTLTPVHIGSGTELQGNFEFLYFPQERKAVVIDERKVLAILGEEQLNHWISVIEERGSLLDLLQQRRPNLKPADVAYREMPVQHSGLSKTTVLREQIHTGAGIPFLPGSSLKGALRTAIWAHSIYQEPEKVQQLDNLGVRGGERFRFSDQTLGRQIFGNDPNHDIFRLLLIGDAHFNRTACYKTEVVNLGNDDWHIKPNITQFVEAIPAGEKAVFDLHQPESLIKQAEKTQYFNPRAELLRPEQLFPLVNQHTRRLVQNEINYWRDDQGDPEILGSYLEDLDNILAQIDTADVRDCILRLGWGTGFRSMTGAWHILMTDADFYRLVRSMRPRHDEEIVFPKTTRFVAGGMPMGFVKLSIQ